ncbi:MAG: aminoacyl-tRNA hydrolase [Patescibacteria group bacterium]|mgnify:CR=1 FL=1
MKLIIGLGNPGKKYEKTRHNAGFMAVDGLWRKLKETNAVADWELSKKFNAEIAEAQVGMEKIILVKPMTFMNDSGQTAQMIRSYYQIEMTDLLVVHDDKDLPLGVIKTQTDRGHAGHNGVRSIVDLSGTQNFSRVRVGIAPSNPEKMADVSAFVLHKFGLFEKKDLQKALAEAVAQMIKFIEK